MNYIQYTEFRNKSKTYLDKVEEGNEYTIIRKGKPVARIIPFETKSTQGWKREVNKVKLQKSTTSIYLRQDRDSR
ncbi:MAG: type II toxin-antitoxin system Phd/YefM family antitoxin [Bacteroidota bacterium]